MHKFIKGTTKKKLVIPNAVMELSGFEKGAPVEIIAADDTVIVLKHKMSAMALIRAVDSFQRLAVELNEHLARVCGHCEACDGCDGENCPADPARTQTILPDAVREEIGVPDGVKLCACPGEEPGTAIVCQADYRYDLTDVPAWELTVLRNMGVCLSELEELLMSEDTVYG